MTDYVKLDDLNEAQWKQGLMQCANAPVEMLLMGCFCSPCLFGLTHGRVNERSSIPYALAYAFHCLGYQLATYGVISGVATPIVAGYASSLCGACMTGLYAGRERVALRRKYGIGGSFCDDCLVHACFPSCALIQEASHVMP